MLKYNIIPKPNSYKTLEGTYTVSQSTEVLCDRSFVLYVGTKKLVKRKEFEKFISESVEI